MTSVDQFFPSHPVSHDYSMYYPVIRKVYVKNPLLLNKSAVGFIEDYTFTDDDSKLICLISNIKQNKKS